MRLYKPFIFIIFLACLVSGCGFHFQAKRPLAQPLHLMYLETNNPYGTLAKNLRQLLKASDVELVSSRDRANTMLVILDEKNTKKQLSVNISQQTRQYELTSTVNFEITDKYGNNLLPLQSLSESRTMAVQTNLVLGGSNQADMIFEQLKSSLARAMMNRLSSFEVSKQLTQSFSHQQKSKEK